MNQAGRPRVLLPVLGCVLLVVIALALLVPGAESAQPSGARAQGGTTASPSPEAATTTSAPSAEAPTPPSVAAPSTSPSATAVITAGQVLPSGAPAAADGPAADPRIEAEFQATHPSDLSAQDAAQVRNLTLQVWTAETTGEGRERWPDFFPPTATPLRPYTQVRVQAISAHTTEGRVIVELLWAGADPSGTYQDRRPGAIAVTRTPAGWEPVR